MTLSATSNNGLLWICALKGHRDVATGGAKRNPWTATPSEVALKGRRNSAAPSGQLSREEDSTGSAKRSTRGYIP